jgi:exo-beta-1,3-glucanase (GH17 family)
MTGTWMRAVALIAAAALAVAANFAFWYLPNRPVELQRPWTGDPIRSVSFAPFRDGQSPLTKVYPSAAEIEHSLRALQGQVAGVRTYTAREGLEIVPALARKYGMTVTHSAWLGTKKAINDAEIAALIDQANRYPDTISRVIVGNEVLLRRDLKPEELAGYIHRVKAAVRQPVSYADVWEFWLKHREQAKEVDFITVHFLPYWEDHPVGVDGAMEHILAVHRMVREAFPGKPILIGEVGWPSAGRSREGAVPGRVNAAHFVADFLDLAARHGLDYNIVEAFDQPWKTRLEGTVGGNWGLFDAALRPKFGLAAPVVEEPRWPAAFAASTLLALLAAVWAAPWRRRFPPRAQGGIVLLAQVLATMLVAAALSGVDHAYDGWRALSATLHLGLQAALAAAIFAETLRCVAVDAADPPFRSVAASLADFRAHWALYLPLGRSVVSAPKLARFAAAWRDWLGEWLLLLAALLAFYQTAMLVWNGRYRDFPIEGFLVPAFGFLAARLVVAAARGGGLAALSFGAAFGGGLPTARHDTRREAGIVLALIAAAVALVIVEKPSNREAVFWTLTVAALAVPYLASWLAVRRVSGRKAPAPAGRK